MPGQGGGGDSGKFNDPGGCLCLGRSEIRLLAGDADKLLSNVDLAAQEAEAVNFLTCYFCCQQTTACCEVDSGRVAFGYARGEGCDGLPKDVIQKGMEVAIEVVVQFRDLTGEEDATLVEALDLEGSPPAGGRIIRMTGLQGGGRRIRGIWDSGTDYERFRNSRLIPALRGLDRALKVIEKWPATETTSILDVT
jgi:hypothetical protein